VWRVIVDHRDFRLLLGAGLISMIGDWILRIGLAYYIYAITGSTLALATMLLASFLPQILLSSVAGVFVDRWDRKHTMVVANLLLCVGLAPLTLVQSAERVWIVYAVLMWEGAVQVFFSPAEQALIPNLVPDERLVSANALSGQNQDLSRLVGSALGGVVSAAGGITALAAVDGATFALSAVMVAAVRTSGRADTSPGEAAPAGLLESRLGRLWNEWSQGLRAAGSDQVLRLVFVFVLVTSIGEGIMGTLFAPFVRDVLHGSGQAYALIVSVQAVGGIAGGLVAASVGHRVSAVYLFGWGAIAFGIVDLAMFLYPLAWVAVWPAAACMVVVGLPGALTAAGFMTLFQRCTADSYRGRVFGAMGLVQSVAMVVGAVGAGFLGASVGIVPIIALQGGGYLLAGCAVVVLLRDVARAPLEPGAAQSPDRPIDVAERTSSAVP
jgi:Na+/melibiose symporter-like transporter